MLRILTVVCLVGAAMAHMGGEAMMKKYAYMKIMSSCLGEEEVNNYKMEMKAASDKCAGQDVTEIMMDIKGMLQKLRQRYNKPNTRQSQNPVYVPVPFYVQQQQQVPQFGQLPQFPNFRTKRSMGGPDLSPEGIKKMKERMMAKISNVTCVMQELNYIDANKKPNYAYMEEKFNNLNVDPMLKEDLLEAMDMCRDFANCKPVEKATSPVKKELGTAMAFMKCLHMKKAMVCMKNDLRKYAPMMGFEGDVNTTEGEDMVDEIHAMLTEGPESMM